MSDTKKKLSAKQYLRQLEELDIIIRQDMEILEEMRMDAWNANGVDYSIQRVQSSVSGDQLGGHVTRYVMFAEQINAEMDGLTGVRNQIISEIRGLHNRDYMQLLFKVYVQFKSIRQAAEEMKRSYGYAAEVHKQALMAFEETYKNLYYLI